MAVFLGGLAAADQHHKSLAIAVRIELFNVPITETDFHSLHFLVVFQ